MKKRGLLQAGLLRVNTSAARVKHLFTRVADAFFSQSVSQHATETSLFSLLCLSPNLFLQASAKCAGVFSQPKTTDQHDQSVFHATVLGG